MDTQETVEKLRKINQRHLLLHWDRLSQIQQYELLKQIDRLDSEMFLKQQALLRSPQRSPTPFSPFTDYFYAKSSTDAQFGRNLISDGKMGCLLIAGGQASRLRSDIPKGFFPVSIIKHKSLFQLFSEKVLAASRRAGRPLLLAIMTSPLSHTEIVSYFHTNHFFGLDPDQVFFYTQGVLPLLNEEGNLFLETRSKIAEGPNGNGEALHYFYNSGIWEQWNDLGIRYLNFVLIDNPLADPFDDELVGFHARMQNEITVKCTSRRDEFEKVGVIVKQEDSCRVIEYSEFPKEEWEAINSNHTLVHQCANLSLFCFSMNFIEKIALDTSIDMPLHIVKKAAKKLSIGGETLLPDQPNAWKFETFIFDLLPFSKKVKALLYPREQCYAALKNLTGEDSIESIHLALQTIDYQTYYHISGKVPPSRPFELAQDFHYPTPYLLSKWKGRDLPAVSYIEP